MSSDEPNTQTWNLSRYLEYLSELDETPSEEFWKSLNTKENVKLIVNSITGTNVHPDLWKAIHSCKGLPMTINDYAPIFSTKDKKKPIMAGIAITSLFPIVVETPVLVTLITGERSLFSSTTELYELYTNISGFLMAHSKVTRKKAALEYLKTQFSVLKNPKKFSQTYEKFIVYCTLNKLKATRLKNLKRRWMKEGEIPLDFEEVFNSAIINVVKNPVISDEGGIHKCSESIYETTGRNLLNLFSSFKPKFLEMVEEYAKGRIDASLIFEVVKTYSINIIREKESLILNLLSFCYDTKENFDVLNKYSKSLILYSENVYEDVFLSNTILCSLKESRNLYNKIRTECVQKLSTYDILSIPTESGPFKNGIMTNEDISSLYNMTKITPVDPKDHKIILCTLEEICGLKIDEEYKILPPEDIEKFKNPSKSIEIQSRKEDIEKYDTIMKNAPMIHEYFLKMLEPLFSLTKTYNCHPPYPFVYEFGTANQREIYSYGNWVKKSKNMPKYIKEVPYNINDWRNDSALEQFNTLSLKEQDDPNKKEDQYKLLNDSLDFFKISLMRIEFDLAKGRLTIEKDLNFLACQECFYCSAKLSSDVYRDTKKNCQWSVNMIHYLQVHQVFPTHEFSVYIFEILNDLYN